MKATNLHEFQIISYFRKYLIVLIMRWSKKCYETSVWNAFVIWNAILVKNDLQGFIILKNA